MLRALYLSPRLILLALIAAAPLRAGFFGPPKDVDVNVVVDLTDDGRKVAPPSREHPAFYYPVLAGYREMGALVAGEKSPPPTPVARLLAKALAAQHYFVVGPKTPPPSLILVFHWGYMNPQVDDVGTDDAPQQLFWNEKEMLALVAGNTLGNLGLSFEREDVLQAARDDRYFVIVSAYDFEAAKQKKKKLLWQAKMSTPSNRVTLAEVLPAMIASGGPHFGRETERPKSVAAPIVREGKVEIGTPTVVDDAAKAPAKPETPPKK